MSIAHVLQDRSHLEACISVALHGQHDFANIGPGWQSSRELEAIFSCI